MLFAEYEDVLSRDSLWKNSLVSESEREVVLGAFLSVCRWTEVFFAWRQNLPDEADNHLIELAVAWKCGGDRHPKHSRFGGGRTEVSDVTDTDT